MSLTIMLADAVINPSWFVAKPLIQQSPAWSRIANECFKTAPTWKAKELGGYAAL